MFHQAVSRKLRNLLTLCRRDVYVVVLSVAIAKDEGGKKVVKAAIEGKGL